MHFCPRCALSVPCFSSVLKLPQQHSEISEALRSAPCRLVNRQLKKRKREATRKAKICDLPQRGQTGRSRGVSWWERLALYPGTLTIPRFSVCDLRRGWLGRRIWCCDWLRVGKRQGWNWRGKTGKGRLRVGGAFPGCHAVRSCRWDGRMAAFPRFGLRSG